MESCLLCLELHNENIDSIKVNSTQWQELDIEILIEKHLWPMHTLQLSSLLCNSCWEQLYDFHKFYKRIKNAHMNFGILMKIEIANNKAILMQETELTPESIIEEENIKEVYEEDLWNVEVPLLQITKNCPDIPNTNETIIKDPLNTATKLDNKYATKTKIKQYECSIKKDQPQKQIPCENLAKEQIKTEIASLEVIKEYNYEDLNSNSNSDSNNEPAKKTTLARSNLNKQKDKFIAENFKLICELCQIPMETFYALSKHFAKKHQQRPHAICCNKKFYERSYLLNHLKQHLSPNCYKCEDCNKICPTPESLKVHSKIHDKNRERNYFCNVCSLSFYNSTTLDMHKTRHLSEDEKLFSCSKCDKNFGSNATLKSHIRTMHGVHLTCNFCGLKCVNRFTLTNHIDVKHSMNVKEYVCSICSKISYNQRSHERHVKDVHQTGYIHKCTMCDKAFKKSKALKQHISIHTGIPLNKCLWCPQTFKRDSNLSVHRRKRHPKEWEEFIRKKYSGNLPPTYKTFSTNATSD